MASKEQNSIQKEYNKLLTEARRLISVKNDAESKSFDIAEKILELAKGQLDLFVEQGDAIEDLNENLKQTQKEAKKTQKETSKIFGKLSESATDFASGFKGSASSIFDRFEVDVIGAITKMGDLKDKASGVFNTLKSKPLLGRLLTVGGATAGIAFASIAVGFAMLVKKAMEVDNATAELVKTTGILDSSLSTTLIEATEQSALLGGNIGLAADAVKSLTDNLSPAISLTGKLVGNVANISERFGLGTENATKLTRIVSELTSTTFEQASTSTEGLIDSLGRLGPAVVRNLVESYDDVIDKFGIGLESLKQQALQATQLGLSLSKVADVSEKLLDFQTSISSEFKASAILGRQINLQKARQLAFEGNIVGALNETLDRVEEIGDFEQLNFFQRRAIADATGLSVSELQKELNLRRQLGTLGRIDARTRETALGKIEQITRRLQSAIFEVLASPSVQAAFDNLADALIRFVNSGAIEKIINIVERAVDFGGRFFGGGGGGNPLFEVDDAVITPQGQVVKTNPRDYIIATQNPRAMISGGGNDIAVTEMIGLLRDLKQNGVRAEVNLDGKKVSRQIALSNRY